MNQHDALPDGRLKRIEAWINRHQTRLLRIAFVIMFVVSIASAYGVWRAFTDFKNESAVRRDQSCANDEREDRDNVDQLRQTYQALASPTIRAQLGPGLVRLIVVQLPEAEAKVRNHHAAPPYCNAPGVGLPEDPSLCHYKVEPFKGAFAKHCPDRPPKRRDFSFLLAPSNTPP